MAKIHHTQTKMAEKLGLAIVVHQDGTIELRDKSDEQQVAIGDDMRELLEQAKAFFAGEKVLDKAVTRTVHGTTTGSTRAAKDAKPKKRKAAPVEIECDDMGDETDDARQRSGVMVYDYYAKYRANGGNCGDDLATVLREFTTMIDGGKSGRAKRQRLDLAALEAVAKENGLRSEFDNWKQRGCNSGMLRMNLSNMLRAKLGRGDPVTVNGQKVKLK